MEPVPAAPFPAPPAGQRQRFAAAYALLEKAIGAHVFPGCAFAVLSGEDLVALDGLGSFTYEPAAPQVTARSIYDLASLTKVLATASAAMLLFDRGILRLDQRLGDLLPGFVTNASSGSPRHRVTLRMLLDHSSGLPGYARLFETSVDAEALYQACLSLPLTAEPGARAEYSDIGFILLGHALEALAAEPLDCFCTREIFAPLCMETTRFCPPPAWRASIPPTEDDRGFRHAVVQGVVHDENAFVLGGVSGHAGLFSNALDPLRLALCLLAGGSTPSGAQLFSPEAVRLFTTRTQTPPGSSRALGWDTPSAPSSSGQYFSQHSAGHLGFTGTSLWIDFERRIAVVLLSNRTWPDRANQAIRELRPQFHDAVLRALL